MGTVNGVIMHEEDSIEIAWRPGHVLVLNSSKFAVVYLEHRLKVVSVASSHAPHVKYVRGKHNSKHALSWLQIRKVTVKITRSPDSDFCSLFVEPIEPHKLTYNSVTSSPHH
jgi:hypothetical protein